MARRVSTRTRRSAAHRIDLVRRVQLPDRVRIARCERSPDLGPRIAFFSGGTALRGLSRRLIRYTHNSIHLVTPFDSGGSSAVLREAFRMPAIGDIRNRLMALADQSLHGNPAVFRLFAQRLAKTESSAHLRAELERMAFDRHPLVAQIPDPMRKIIRHYLQTFLERMPTGFDLRGASIGNLVLTAGYLEQRRHFDPVIYIFSRLVQVRGIVRPITSRDLHLAADLSDGRCVVGQERLTRRGAHGISARIDRLYVTADRDAPQPLEVPIRRKVSDLIRSADLICYPMGSFYSSLIANLLPTGVGPAIAATPCPKVFIPNTGHDPEQRGLNLTERAACLLAYLQREAPRRLKPADLLQYVLLDSRHGRYGAPVEREALERLGLQVIDVPLVTPASRPAIDADLLAGHLVSLAL